MSKHTPGPWTIEPLRGKYYGTKITLPDGNGIEVWTPDHYAEPFASEREVAEGWSPEDGHDHIEDVRSYANACLIAAAPELIRFTKEVADGLWLKDPQVCQALAADILARVTGENNNE